VRRIAAAPLVCLSTLLLPTAVPAHAAPGGVHERRVCRENSAVGTAACDAHVVTKADGVTPAASTSYVSGYAPADVQQAYSLSALVGSGGVGRTVAIVDAYDNPNVEGDLAVYRTKFNLGTCASTDGCFRKVDQRGGTAFPVGDVGWGEEIALDVEMVSTACPKCHILLVEADTASIANLGAAVNEAVALGANAVSNSYGAGEFSSERGADAYYTHPGVAITASSGDSGYGVEYPAASPAVTAVGGTSLNRSSSPRGFAESAWSGAGSGCSRFEPKPSFQHDSGCSKRAVADVSAVADPSTGVAVYDSYGSKGGANWYVFGGTSVASPLVAAVFGLAGGSPAVGSEYGHTSALFDVVGGTNGRCRGSYLCTAVAGYDGPTGLGTPNGTAAFT